MSAEYLPKEICEALYLLLKPKEAGKYFNEIWIILTCGIVQLMAINKEWHALGYIFSSLFCFFCISLKPLYNGFLPVTFHGYQVRIIDDALCKGRDLPGRPIASKKFYGISQRKYLFNPFCGRPTVWIYRLADITQNSFFAFK